MSCLAHASLVVVTILTACTRVYVVGEGEPQREPVTTGDAAPGTSAGASSMDASLADAGAQPDDAMVSVSDGAPEQPGAELTLRTWAVPLEGFEDYYQLLRVAPDGARLGVSVTSVEGLTTGLFELDIDSGGVRRLGTISTAWSIGGTALRPLSGGWEVLAFEGFADADAPSGITFVAHRLRVTDRTEADELTMRAGFIPFAGGTPTRDAFVLPQRNGALWFAADVAFAEVSWSTTEQMDPPALYGRADTTGVLALVPAAPATAGSRVLWLREGQAVGEPVLVPQLLPRTPLSLSPTFVVLAEHQRSLGAEASVRLSWRDHAFTELATSAPIVIGTGAETGYVWVVGAGPKQGVFVLRPGSKSAGNEDELLWTETTEPGSLPPLQRLHVGGLFDEGNESRMTAWQVRPGQYAVYFAYPEPRVFVVGHAVQP